MFFKYKNEEESDLNWKINKGDFDLKYSYEERYNRKNKIKIVVYAMVLTPLLIYIIIYEPVVLLFVITIYWLFPNFFIYLKHCLIKKFSKDKRQAYIVEIRQYNEKFYYRKRNGSSAPIYWKNKGQESIVEDKYRPGRKLHEIKTNDILYIIVECDGCKFEIEGIENNLAFKSLQRNLEEQKKIPIEIYVWKNYAYANLESVPKQYLV